MWWPLYSSNRLSHSWKVGWVCCSFCHCTKSYSKRLFSWPIWSCCWWWSICCRRGSLCAHLKFRIKYIVMQMQVQFLFNSGRCSWQASCEACHSRHRRDGSAGVREDMSGDGRPARSRCPADKLLAKHIILVSEETDQWAEEKACQMTNVQPDLDVALSGKWLRKAGR